MKYISRFDESQVEVYRDGVKLKTEDSPKAKDIDEDSIEAMYLSGVDELVIVLKKTASTHGRYQVKLKVNAVFDAADNGNSELLTTKTETLGFMVKSMVVDANAKTITLDFSKDIRSANSISVYQNSKLLMLASRTVAVSGGDLIITFTNTINWVKDVFYVLFHPFSNILTNY